MEKGTKLSEEDSIIFYGPLNVNLYPVTGVFRQFDPERIKVTERTPENIKIALKDLDDLTYLNKAYVDHYVPCVPSTRFIDQSKTPEGVNDPSSDIYALPLLKLAPGKDEDPAKICRAITSGHRSAILPGKDGIFYRLKGCGNDLQGFVIEKTEGFIPNSGIRGSGFADTSLRELYFAYHLTNILKPYNIPVANYPVGYWKYGKDLKVTSPADKKEQPENQMIELDKYCGIFRTLGERRLGSHLLNGFDIILHAIVKIAIEKYGANEDDYKLLASVYPKGREEKKFHTYRVLRNFEPPIVDKKQMPIKEWAAKPIYQKEDYAALIPYAKLASKETKTALKKIIDACNDLKELYRLLAENEKPERKKLLTSAFEALSKSLVGSTKPAFDYLIDIYTRLGYEVATTKRVMQDEDINWGTFIDHSPVELHCNAHCNNFAVIPKGLNNLLAPLDFDLAISRKDFFCIVRERAAFGTYEEDLFDSYLNTERYELSKGLGGEENMNFEYTLIKASSVPTLGDKLKSVVEFMLRDVMVETYMKTFDKIKCDYVIKDTDSCDPIHSLVKIAVILTHNLIA